MARFAFENAGTGVQPSSSGGWKQLLWFMVAAAGVGFAGYVYLIPYLKMERAVSSRQAELSTAHRTADEAIAERDRLKSDLAKYIGSDKERSEAEAKRKTTAEALATGLRPGLEQLGGTVTVNGAVLAVSFGIEKVIDTNGIDVSESGLAGLKILAAAAKKENAKIRIHARTSSAVPPKDLRNLFASVGELRAVRAARVMTALEEAGFPAGHLEIFGEAERPVHVGRGRKAPPPPPDHLDLEVEPE